MTWRLKIRHSTGYRYTGEVRSSYNEARVTPLSTDRQVAVETSVEVTPATRTYRYWDYWGTLVDAFDVHEPHTELSVVGTSVVETSPPEVPADTAGWDDLTSRENCDRFAEMLTPTLYVPMIEEGLEEAPARDGLSPAQAVEAAAAWVHDRLEYAKGTTDVRTTALDALHVGSGVCQDFAHLTLAVLRRMGIPSRYVSGYFHPRSSAEEGSTATGESHAWVEAWTGEWWGFDPTHGVPVGERHVLVGRARDYADVSPLKGIYHGAPAEGLTVSVEITRLE
ncbi:MAG TPA: transglutaminase family protein [Acidimicrobiales bacterium]|nr:transglutaminase family protein [Acidimicrobiales bacterium]